MTKRLIGNPPAAVIAATETQRVNLKVTNQIRAPTSAASGINPKSAPAEVATPLPPLNRSHTGNECPITEETAAVIPNRSGENQLGCVCFAIKIDRITAAKPFRKSTANTG